MRNSLKYTLLTWVLSLSAASATTINVPADHSTIQAALNAADSSETVLVQPGTYYENIIWPDVNGIKLISAGDSSNTIIDGGGTSSVIYMNPATTIIDTTTLIQGFKITNGGNVQYGGGVFISNASPLLKQLFVVNNIALSSGGGVHLDNGNPTLRSLTVSDNSADIGAGINIRFCDAKLSNIKIIRSLAGSNGGGLFMYGGNSIFEEVDAVSNEAGGSGGGFYLVECEGMITKSEVISNIAGGDGGGIYITRDHNLSILSTTISENVAGGSGGGINLYTVSSPTLTNLIITYNRAYTAGGIYFRSGTPTMTDIIISHNTANEMAGGLYIYSSLLPDYLISNITISENSAGSDGGGLYIRNPSSGSTGPIIINSTICRNSAGSGGGGLHIYRGGPIFRLMTITNNNSTSGFHGIFIIGDAPTFSNSNIAYHGTCLYNNDNSNLIDADSVWWGHSNGPYHPVQNPNSLGDSVNAFVDVTPWLAEPDTAAPPIPVQNLTINSTGYDFVELSWDASLIGDLAGYKIYFDTDSSGFPYDDTVDVGNNTLTTLSGLVPGLAYYITATCYDTDGNESWYSKEVSATPAALAVKESSNIPTSFALHQAYPNPFNPTTTIRFDLPHSVDISIVVYDLLGREVVPLVDGDMTAGYHQVIWDGRTASGREVPTGIYIARLITPQYTKSIKMVLLK